ncbi:MFS transporter [Sorangium sp. So ce134]
MTRETAPKILPSASSRAVRLSAVLPVVLPAFVDRVGGSGINLLSAYLVHLDVPARHASIVLGCARSASIVGPLLTGFFVDRLGNYQLGLVAFCLTGAAFLALPIAGHWLAILMLAFAAQFGMAMNRVCLRGLVFDRLPPEWHRESLGWLRTAHNFGSLCAFGLASVLALWSMPLVFVWDGATSVAAAMALLALVGPGRTGAAQAARARPADQPEGAPRPTARRTIALLLLFSLASFFWGWCYNLFAIGMPARLERLMPGSGASLFFRLLLINTLLAGFLAVRAARLFDHPGVALTLGTLLISLGAVITCMSQQVWVLVLGVLVWTVGEIAFMAVSTFILGKLAQATARPGLWFAVGTSLTSCGPAAAGALAFPLVVNSPTPAVGFLLLGAPALVCSLVFLRYARKDRVWPELL